MTTSPTLPLLRRLLAMLNWRPTYDIEKETERVRIESFESEKHLKLLQESDARIARFEQEHFFLLGPNTLHWRFPRLHSQRIGLATWQQVNRNCHRVAPP
jgi:hypothetical protein